MEQLTDVTVKDVITATLTQADVDEFNAAQAETAREQPDENLSHARRLNRLVRERRAIWERADKEAKSRKKLFEAAQEELNDFLDALDEELPLFDQKPAVPAAVEGEEWREEPIAQLVTHGLADSIVQALEEAEILTMGQLADWTKDGKRRPEDIPGIGPAKAESLGKALEAFWTEYMARERAKLDAAVHEAAKEAEAAKQVHEADPGPETIEAKKSRKRKAG